MHIVSLDLSQLFLTPYMYVGICRAIAQAAAELCQKDSSLSGLFTTKVTVHCTYSVIIESTD